MTKDYHLIHNLLGEVQVPVKGILSRTMYNDDQTKLILFGFAAGEELSAHTAPMPAIIQILSGDVTLTLGPDSHKAGPGSLVYMAPQLTHGIAANTESIVLLTLLKLARQEKTVQAP